MAKTQPKTEAPAAPSPRDLIVRLLLALVLIGGTGVGVYLTWHHDVEVYGDATAELENCPQTETVNCEVVNTSEYSELFGIPIAALSIPTYLLLLWLVFRGRKQRGPDAWAFSIALLTVLYSVFLYWVSVSKIGYRCAWCMRLYGVNAALGLGTWALSLRAPWALLGETFAALRSWPTELRRAAVLFAALFVVTGGAEMAFRTHVSAEAEATREALMAAGGPGEPAIPKPQAPPSEGQGKPASPQVSSNAKAQVDLDPAAWRVPDELQLARASVDGGELKLEPFDLQAPLAQGQPTALLFWFPEFAMAEDALVTLSKTLKERYPQLRLWAISGLRDGQRPEEVWERFSALDLPAELPLVVDRGFALSRTLNVTDVPNLALFDHRGALVAAKLKSLAQEVITPQGRSAFTDLLAQVAAGGDVAPPTRVLRHYPSADLFGHPAPKFEAPDFRTGERRAFDPRNPKKRPTLLMFWSSTCKHCQQEIPQLLAYQKAHPGEFDIVTVSRIKKPKKGKASHRDVTEAYLKRLEIPWTVYEDPGGAVSERYRVISTPTTFLLHPDGTVDSAWYYAHGTNFERIMGKTLTRLKAPPATPPTPGSALERPRLDLKLRSPAGAPTDLKTALGGKPGLVHLWATWCKPCIKELPTLLPFTEKLAASGEASVVMLSVEDADAGPTISEFIAERGLKMQSHYGPELPSDALSPSWRVPRTYLVAADGTLVDVRYGDQAWDDPLVQSEIEHRLGIARTLAD